MAVNNRTEAIIETNNQLVPTIDASELRAYLNDEVLNSVVFEKDVIVSQTPTAGAVTIDYANKDLATVTTAVDLAVSFTNLENGAVKYLEITKAAANVISFVGALDIAGMTSSSTVVLYRVLNKNGTIYIESLFAQSSVGWSNMTLSTGWTGAAKCRYNELTGKVQVYLNVSYGVGASSNICNLPASLAPNQMFSFALGVGGILSNAVKTVKVLIIATLTGISADMTGITPGDFSATVNGYFEFPKSI